MKKYLAWLHGLPLVIYIGLGFLAWTKFTEYRAVHRASDERFLASTIVAFKEINDINTDLQRQIAAAKKAAAKATANADREKQKQNEILAAHPVSTAPASCAPWTQALLSCQREAQDLRVANTILNSSLDSAKAVSERVDTTLKSGTRALENARCKFPCIDIVVGAGVMLDDEIKVRKGLFLGVKLK